MPVRFRCPNGDCDKLLSVSRRKAGSVVHCPRCAQKILVPHPPSGAAPPEAPQARDGRDEAPPGEFLFALPEAHPPADDHPRPRPRVPVALLAFTFSGMLLLGLVVLVWKLSQGPAVVRKTPDGRVVAVNGEQAERGTATSTRSSRTGEAAWAWVKVFLFLGGVVAFVYSVGGMVSACPRCNRWWAMRFAGQRVVSERRRYGLVRRYTYSTSSARGANGQTVYGSGIGSYQERVPVIETTSELTYRCRCCGAETVQTKVEEVEDFDRG